MIDELHNESERERVLERPTDACTRSALARSPAVTAPAANVLPKATLLASAKTSAWSCTRAGNKFIGGSLKAVATRIEWGR